MQKTIKVKLLIWAIVTVLSWVVVSYLPMSYLSLAVTTFAMVLGGYALNLLPSLSEPWKIPCMGLFVINCSFVERMIRHLTIDSGASLTIYWTVKIIAGLAIILFFINLWKKPGFKTKSRTG